MLPSALDVLESLLYELNIEIVENRTAQRMAKILDTHFEEIKEESYEEGRTAGYKDGFDVGYDAGVYAEQGL